MKKNIIILLVVIIVVGIGFFLASIRSNRDGDSGFDPAPDFILNDYEGREVSMDDFIGKVVVINSWAVRCPFCKDELPDFARLQEHFGDEVAVVAIDRAESVQKAKEFTDSIGVTDKMTFLLDPRDSFYRSIGGFTMPETIFVDVEGNIRIHKRGPMDFDEMKEKVESILPD